MRSGKMNKEKWQDFPIESKSEASNDASVVWLVEQDVLDG